MRLDGDPSLHQGNQLQPYTTALEQEFEVFWRGLPEQIAAHLSDSGKQTALEHEAAFVDKVYSAISQLAETHDGPITALFDVDETIARNTFGRDGSMTTFVRPGFGVLVHALNQTFGERIGFGLLTSRAQSHLEEELISPSYTQAIVGKINPDFVISSRDGNLLMEHESLRDVPMCRVIGEEMFALNAIRQIIDPQLARNIEADDQSAIRASVDRGQWYDTKLAILTVLTQEHPERGFVLVDDLPFPAAIDTQHPQVRGVSLGDEALFNFSR